ncbi:MAG: recombination-associated protein RdgC [Sinobacterium sp.]|nr:recombination-associated protein RdgC [Sinobacterium sp.]
MWFKNLSVFRLTKPFTVASDDLHEKLIEQAFEPVTSQEPKSFGWVTPLGKHSDLLVHSANGYTMICAKRQEKMLPASVVNEKVEEKVSIIEQEESRKVARKERQNMKDEITFDLLPRAFAKSSLLFAYIAPEEGLIVVNSSSAKASEELLSLLRESIGSLAVIPLTAKNLPMQTMTHWLSSQEIPNNFTLGGECELKELQDNGSIKCKEQDLLSEEIASHISAGLQVTQLSLQWQEKIECVVDEKLTIKRLKFSDLIQEAASDKQAESMAEQFDVDFTLMTSEIKPFLAELVVALGGEVDAKTYVEEQLVKASNLEAEESSSLVPEVE